MSSVHLPLSSEHSEDSNVLNNASLAKALIIEDDPVARFAVKSALEKAGYLSVEAHTAYGGYAGALQYKPDFIVTDLGLPDDDGFTLIERLQNNEATKGIPIVVLTAHGWTRGLARSYDFCVTAFLRKPISLDKLLQAVGKIEKLGN